MGVEDESGVGVLLSLTASGLILNLAISSLRCSTISNISILDCNGKKGLTSLALGKAVDFIIFHGMVQ